MAEQLEPRNEQVVIDFPPMPRSVSDLGDKRRRPPGVLHLEIQRELEATLQRRLGPDRYSIMYEHGEALALKELSTWDNRMRLSKIPKVLTPIPEKPQDH